MASNRLTWIIQVCPACGRLAEWCQDHDVPPQPVKVIASARDSKRLVAGFTDWPDAKRIGR